MKALFNLLVILVAAAAGLGLGFLFRGKSKATNIASSPPSFTTSDGAPKRLGASKRNIPLPARDASPLVAKLERDLSMSSGVTRWLYWLEALEKATPQDFPRLARLAKGNSTALRFVAARWVELDPRHMFDTIAAASSNNDGFPVNELAQTLFDEWPKRDPKAVIEALDSDTTFRSRGWRMNVAADIFNSDVELGLSLMSKWHITGYIPNMKGVSKWAAANPRYAAQFTADNPVDLVSREMMKTIGKEWAATDPVAALEFANGKPGELGWVLANATLKQWADRDLKGASEWLANADSGTRGRLGAAFVESWAKSDSLGALEWCALNLSGSSLAQAVGGVFKGAAQKDLAGAQNLVAQMNASKARAEAAAAIAQRAFPDAYTEKVASPETIAWLKDLDPRSVKRALDEVYWKWVSTDVPGLAQFLKTDNAQEVSSHIFDNVARNLARKNPTEALAWAAELPPERGLEVGGEAFAEWRRAQPEAATQWLNKLPESDPRRDPYFETAIRTLAYDTHAAQQLATLSASERSAARRVIETMRLPDEQRTKLLGMLGPR